MVRKVLFAALAALVATAPALAATPLSGTTAMNEWNLIVLDELSGGSAHVHGRAFVGGSITIQNASDFNMDQAVSSRGQPGLTVVGDVKGNGKQVWGGATVGGNVTSALVLNGVNRIANVGGTMPAVNAGSSANTGLASNPSFSSALNAQRTELINSMISLSDSLKTLTSSGSIGGVTIANNTAAFTSNGNGLAVINVSAANFNSVGQLTFAKSGTGITIVNVAGTDIVLNDNFNGASSALGEKVLWNFYEAKTIILTNSFYGSILAPKATGTFGQDVYGSVVINNLSLNGQIHPGTFNGMLPPVPEPATWAMMIFGFGLIGRAMRSGNTRTAQPV